MAKDIEIEVKVGGLSELKRGLKEAKDELIALQSSDVIDPDKIRAAEARAGQLRDTLNDVNERIAVMSGGSDFEKVSNGLGLIGDQLSNMDFEGAAQSAKLLTSTIKGMSPETVAAGFKDMIGTVAQLGKAFMTMGMQLLANPLFLLVAVVVAIVAAIILLKDKLVIAQKAFDLMMAPINLLIDGLKTLTDWMGLTAFAAEESAERQIAATNRQLASSKDYMNKTEASYSRKIALLKAEGKSTEEAEIQLNKIRQSQSYKNIKSIEDSIKQKEGLLSKQTREQQKATKEELDGLKKSLDEETQSNLNAQNEIKVIKATSATEANKEAEKKREENLKNSKSANDKLIVEQQRLIDELKRLEGQYVKDIEDLNVKTDEERLALQKKRDQLVIDELKNKGLNTTKVQEEFNKKYNILEVNLEQEKLNKLKEITDTFNREIFMLKTTSKQEQLKLEEEEAIAEIDKVTKNETDKEEAKKAVREKYALLKREADAATFMEENDKELMKLEDDSMKFEDRYALIKEREDILKNNTTLTEEERTQIEKDNADARIAIAQSELAARTATLGAIGDALSGFTSLVGEQTAAGKAMAIAQATISAYTGIANVWGAPSPYPEPYGTAVKIASTVAVATSAFANIKKIVSTKVPGKSAGGSVPSGAGGGASAPVQPSFNLVGGANRGNEATASKTVENNINNNNQPIMVTAVVSETQVTDTQNRVRRIQDNAEL